MKAPSFWEVTVEDALPFLSRVPDSSVDLYFTDPPYGSTNFAWDVRPEWGALWAEIGRVLVPEGTAVIFTSQPFATDLIASNRPWYRYELVWRKTTSTRYLDANRRPLLAHETLQVFSPRRGYYSAQKTFVGPRGKNATRRPTATLYSPDKGNTYRDDGWRHPTSVLTFAKPPRVGRLHPAEKPVDLCRWVVTSYCPLGGLVVDPFCGSGPVAVACRQSGRNFRGCDIDPAFVEAAVLRLKKDAGGGPEE